jgi:hypothetical protein
MREQSAAVRLRGEHCPFPQCGDVASRVFLSANSGMREMREYSAAVRFRGASRVFVSADSKSGEMREYSAAVRLSGGIASPFPSAEMWRKSGATTAD